VVLVVLQFCHALAYFFPSQPVFLIQNIKKYKKKIDKDEHYSSNSTLRKQPFQETNN